MKKVKCQKEVGIATLDKQAEIIHISDAHGEGLTCSLCGEEDGTVRLSLKSAVNGKGFMFVIGPLCRLGIEAGLRGHRKWEIRGGKDIVTMKMQNSKLKKEKKNAIR